MSSKPWILTKSHLLFAITFSSIVLIAAVLQPSFHFVAATPSLTASPTNEEDERQGERETETVLVNTYLLSSINNITTKNITTTGPTDLMLNSRQCLNEWAIYIHGIWTDREAAIEQAQRIDLSLPIGEKIPLFVFLWEGTTSLSPFGWDRAKSNADSAGHELARLISESRSACPSDKIRLIAHSLGSRVILSALESLDNNSRWKLERFNITSVHLMGAAVDDEKISKNPIDIDHGLFDDGKVYGNAIERNVVKFYNLFNPEDDMLERLDQIEGQREIQPEFYPRFEIDDALGSKGIQQASIDEVDIPTNYEEQNVQNELLPVEDADAGYIIEEQGFECDIISYIHPFNCTISGSVLGDNHLGYMGFRDPNNSSRLILNGGDGAINILVSDWQRK